MARREAKCECEPDERTDRECGARYRASAGGGRREGSGASDRAGMCMTARQMHGTVAG